MSSTHGFLADRKIINAPLILNGGTVTTVTHIFSDASSGAVQLDGALLSYAGLKSIQDSLQAADRTFRFGDRNDLITLAIDTTPYKMSTLTSRNSSVAVDFRNPSQSLLLNGGGGDDVIFVKQLGRGDLGFAVAIDGGPGNDLIDAAGVNFNVTLTGGAGNDLLIGGRGNDVLLDGEGNDILIGGPGDDYLDGGPGSNLLWGGPGHNTLVNGSIQLSKNPGVTGAQKLLMLFDDAEGMFYEPGSERFSAILDWQIDLAPSEATGGKDQNNGDDWIIDLDPQKLHG